MNRRNTNRQVLALAMIISGLGLGPQSARAQEGAPGDAVAPAPQSGAKNMFLCAQLDKAGVRTGFYVRGLEDQSARLFGQVQVLEGQVPVLVAGFQQSQAQYSRVADQRGSSIALSINVPCASASSDPYGQAVGQVQTGQAIQTGQADQTDQTDQTTQVAPPEGSSEEPLRARTCGNLIIDKASSSTFTQKYAPSDTVTGAKLKTYLGKLTTKELLRTSFDNERQWYTEDRYTDVCCSIYPVDHADNPGRVLYSVNACGLEPRQDTPPAVVPPKKSTPPAPQPQRPVQPQPQKPPKKPVTGR